MKETKKAEEYCRSLALNHKYEKSIMKLSQEEVDILVEEQKSIFISLI
jgi:hypothetical protein